jgi:hypothetical protein
MIINESIRVWKEALVSMTILLRNSPEETEENHRKVCHYGRESNRIPCGYNVTATPICYVQGLFKSNHILLLPLAQGKPLVYCSYFA